jgi:predicted nucleic acid-binding protein
MPFHINSENIDSKIILAALTNNDFNDIEDCLQAECAKAVKADYIVTRNIKDYTHSEIPAISPEALIKHFRSRRAVKNQS